VDANRDFVHLIVRREGRGARGGHTASQTAAIETLRDLNGQNASMCCLV